MFVFWTTPFSWPMNLKNTRKTPTWTKGNELQLLSSWLVIFLRLNFSFFSKTCWFGVNFVLHFKSSISLFYLVRKVQNKQKNHIPCPSRISMRGDKRQARRALPSCWERTSYFTLANQRCQATRFNADWLNHLGSWGYRVISWTWQCVNLNVGLENCVTGVHWDHIHTWQTTSQRLLFLSQQGT